MTESAAKAQTTDAKTTAAEYSRAHASRRIRKNAADLRRLAADFDRIAADVDAVPAPGRARAAEVAGRIIHEHAVWLMNAQLHVAMQYAAEFDIYHETGE